VLPGVAVIPSNLLGSIAHSRDLKQLSRVRQWVWDVLAAHSPGNKYLIATLPLASNQPAQRAMCLLSRHISNAVCLACTFHSPPKGVAGFIIRGDEFCSVGSVTQSLRVTRSQRDRFAGHHAQSKFN